MLTPWRSESGIVTAEFALVIPSFLVLLVALTGSFQLGMERISNQQQAQTEAVAAGLGETSDFKQERLEGMVCVLVSGSLEILDGYACAVDYRFSRIDFSADAGVELFGN